MQINDIALNTALDRCRYIEEDTTSITNSSDVRLFSRVGVLLTTDIRMIYELSNTSVRKDLLVCSRLKHLLYFVKPSSDRAETKGVLLIVPPVLASAWSALLSNSKDNKRKIMCVWSQKQLDDADLEESDLLIVSDGVVASNRGTFSRRKYNKVIQCNSANTRVLDTVESDFYWFAYPCVAQARILSQIPTNCQEALTVQFLKPLSAEEIRVEEMYSPTPIENITLEGLVDEVIMRHLNSDDITRALKCISHKDLRTHRDVVRHVLRNFTGTIAQLDAKIYTVEKMEYLCTEEKKRRVHELESKRARVQRRHDELSNRLQNTDENCFICFQKASNTCLTKCCSKRCCFECIHKWFSHNRRCPMCNTTSAEVFVLKEDRFQPSEERRPMCNFFGSKYDNLFTLLQRFRDDDSKHVLVCTSNTDQLRQIVEVVDKCTDQKLIIKRNFRYERLPSGFGVIIQNTDKFPYPVLLPEKLSHTVFFDDRTFDLFEVFAREHATCKTRFWRLRYVTQSVIASQSRSA